MADTLTDNLESYLAPFGLSSFRPGQRVVIETVLAGKDCLCVMPTGGGKSLCYQLPAIAGGGVTLVVSPLIALMKDQVDQLQARGLPATYINSTLAPDEQARRLEGMAAGEYRLVYVVPERFRSPRFVEAARRCQLTLLAVDEAHCVSEWGHDFRPDYARLGRFRGQLGNPPTIALTATATDAVRRDIVELLGLRDPRVFIAGFERPNLFYRVQVCASERDKDQALFAFLAEHAGSGIVYASTRKRCEELGERIAARTGRPTSVYHAGLMPDQRRRAQEDFMQGRTQIAVATLAFGMGIDKADVRFVVHYNLPGSLEAYYQEAGRAGRDAQPASCLLLTSGGDRRIHEFFIESAYPARDVVRTVYQFLCGLEQHPIEMTQQEVKETLGLQITNEGIGACEKLLEAAGVLERLESTENAAGVRLNSDLPTLVDLVPRTAGVKRQILRVLERLVGPKRHEWCYVQPRALLRELVELDSSTLARHMRELSTSLDAVDFVPAFRGRAIHIRRRDVPFDDLAIDFESLERQKETEYERLARVVRFARGSHCRQQQILSYFGQTDSPPCGHCDNCQTATPSSATPVVEAGSGTLEATRIVLSGVARVNQSRRNVGKNLLAQMLCGKSNKSVTRNRLDKLSTFGLLAHLRLPQVVELVDALIVCGLVEQTEIEPFRPIVRLAPRGAEIMSGRSDKLPLLPLSAGLLKQLDAPGKSSPVKNRGEVDEAAPKEARVAGEAPTADAGLAARLRAWRESVRQAENVPPYVIVSNAVIDELARVRPRNVEELLAIKGMGPRKADRYGPEILKLVNESAPAGNGRPMEQEAEGSSGPGAPSSLEELEPSPDEHEQQPSHYWTWRLLSAGFTPDECAAIRSLEPEVVLDHALRAADGGWAIDATWFLAPEVIERIEHALANGGTTRIRHLLEQLPRGTRYEEVQLVQKCRSGQG